MNKQKSNNKLSWLCGPKQSEDLASWHNTCSSELAWGRSLVPVYRQLTDFLNNALKTDNAHTKFPTEFDSMNYCKNVNVPGCVSMWQVFFHSVFFWVKKFAQLVPSSHAKAWFTALLVAAAVDALSALVSKLHVNLPSHCWLQHRLDSWYTCSVRQWAPVSGSWPMSKYAPFSIWIRDTLAADIVTKVKTSIVM